MSTLPVVERILRETAVPMSVREIVERAGETLPTKSKTPDTVVARDLSMDIKKRGEDSLFVRTSPGRYAMREHYGPGMSPPKDQETTSMTDGVSERAGTKSSPKPQAKPEAKPGNRPTTQSDTASA
jgi:hypothetical protein